jgi:hypothetical protein
MHRRDVFSVWERLLSERLLLRSRHEGRRGVRLAARLRKGRKLRVCDARVWRVHVRDRGRRCAAELLQKLRLLREDDDARGRRAEEDTGIGWVAARFCHPKTDVVEEFAEFVQ